MHIHKWWFSWKWLVERELGSGQGDIMTRTPNSKIVIILGHLALVMMLPSLPGIGSDVVLTPGNFQAYPELFSFLYPSTR